MVTNNSGTLLAGGLAALGLALVAGGIGLIRLRRAGNAAGSTSAGGTIDAASALQNDLQGQAVVRDEEQDRGEVLPQDREPGRNRPSTVSKEKMVLEYFGLVVALTIPFWLFGGKPLPVPVKLPVSALALVNPLIAALILTYRRERSRGVKKLLARAWDYKKITNKTWYLPILILNPLIMVLAYALMRLAGLPLPDPQIPWLMVPVFFGAFFIAGIAEELGWMGYVFDPMQDRWGALKASILLGLFWAVFHLIPDLQNGQPADWILWHRVGTVLSRILMAWIYNSTGKSVFSVLLFHTMNNMGWALFPNYGSHYDPFVTSMITLPVVALVLLGWDSRTLAHFRFARLSRLKSSGGQGRVIT